jgi:hypothetical protein
MFNTHERLPMKTLFPTLQRLALYATLGLTPLWLSGCATGVAGVNVPGLQQIIEAGITTNGYGNKIAVHEVIRTQDSFLLTKASVSRRYDVLKESGFSFIGSPENYAANYFFGGIIINNSLWTNIAIEFIQGPADTIKTVRSGDLVLLDTQRSDLLYSESGGRGTPERLAAYRADKWMGAVVLKVLCPSGDNECKRQYVYGLYDKQTGRLMDYSTNEVIANGAIIDPQTGRPLPGYGRDRCPGFTKSCRD